jgi:hypothetical protein
MNKITNTAKDKLKGNQVAIGKLMILFRKSSSTVERWIEDRNAMLTTPNALKIIRQETGLSTGEILEETENIRA